MTIEWWFAPADINYLSLSPGSGAINMTTSINHGYRRRRRRLPVCRPGWPFYRAGWRWSRHSLLRSVLAFEVLKWAGAAYLIWLGIQQWRAAGAIDLNTLAKAQTRGKLFQRAVFVNLTNPKSIVFWPPFFRSLSCRTSRR